MDKGITQKQEAKVPEEGTWTRLFYPVTDIT